MTAQQLAVRLIAEGLVGLPELAKLIPARRGKGTLRTKTLSSWARAGRLEAINDGGRWLSSKAALARALVEYAPAADVVDVTPQEDEAARVERVRRTRVLMGF